MRRVRTLAAWFGLVVSVVVAYPAGASAATPGELVIREINRFRAAYGLQPVHASASLTRSAFSYSRAMMAWDYFGHARRIQASSRFQSLGEVLELHGGRGPAVKATVDSWKRSPLHRAALLDPSYRQIGAGRTYGRFQGRRATVWVVQLGRR